MTLESRVPSIAEAFGYLRRAVALLNREGGIALLFIAFLVAQWVAREALRVAIRDETLWKPAAAWASAVLFTPFAAAAVLKVRRALAGRGVRWVPALEEAARGVFRPRAADWAVAALLGWVLVGPPLSRYMPDALLLASGVVGAAAAAGLAALLLLRGRGRTLMATNLVLVVLVVNYGTYVAIGLTQALAGPLLVAPTLQAVEGVQVNATQGNQTFTVPVGAYCSLTAGDRTSDLLRCLQANLPAERFAALTASVNWAGFLISLLADPSRGLIVLVPLLLILPRLVLALPAAAVEGGLGLRRSWEMTRGGFRVPFWLVVMVLAMNTLLVGGLGFLLVAVGGVVAALYAVRQLGHGRGLDGVVRSTWFQGPLALAGLGLVVMAPLGVGPVLARLFTLAVGGTAVTLYYLERAGAAPAKPGSGQIPRAE